MTACERPVLCSVSNSFKVAEAVYKPHSLLAGVDIGVIIARILPSAKLYGNLGGERQNQNTYYCYPDSHDFSFLKVDN